MADPLRIAKKERTEIDAQVQKLLARRDALDVTINVLQGYRSQEIDFALQSDKPKRSRKNRVVIVEAVSQILSDGKPRNTSVLVAELEQRQVPIAGKNKVPYVAQILSRERAKFTPNRKAGWTLRSGAGTVVPFGKTA